MVKSASTDTGVWNCNIGRFVKVNLCFLDVPLCSNDLLCIRIWFCLNRRLHAQ